MRLQENNFAFIDGQNLYFALKGLGWHLDYRKFRLYLTEKYGVTKAYIFMGYIPSNVTLYSALQSHGFDRIFRPTLTTRDGVTKGNCDAELVLHAMIEYPNYDQALIVTGDGDFSCLIEYLRLQSKLKMLFVPNMNRYSALLKPAAAKSIAFISELRHMLEYKKRTP